MNMFGSFPGKALVVHIKLTGPKEPTTLWNQGGLRPQPEPTRPGEDNLRKATSKGTKRSVPARDVDRYLAALPKDIQVTLEKLRKTIKTAAPKAEETISYQIPAFKYHGPLVFFAAFKNHCSFFVASKSLMETFRRELEPYDTSGTTIHFSAENPLPATLVKKIVKARIEQNELRAKHKQNRSC
jgi:uncharacterized protein YdhG (YjbR/CyaY superfamily)